MRVIRWACENGPEQIFFENEEELNFPSSLYGIDSSSGSLPPPHPTLPHQRAPTPSPRLAGLPSAKGPHRLARDEARLVASAAAANNQNSQLHEGSGKMRIFMLIVGALALVVANVGLSNGASINSAVEGSVTHALGTMAAGTSTGHSSARIMELMMLLNHVKSGIRE